MPTTAAARWVTSSRRTAPNAHNTSGGAAPGRAPAPSKAENASNGHSGQSGVISRPPRRASHSRSAAAESISRLAAVRRTSSSPTSPRRTRAAASTGPTDATSADSAGHGGSATRDRYAQAGQVGKTPRDAQRAVEPANAEQPALHRQPQRIHGLTAGPVLSPQQRSAHFGVGGETVWPPPRGGRVTGLGHPLPHLLGGFTVDGSERAGPHRMHLYSQVHPIQKRARQLAQVAAFGRGRAHAVLWIGRRAGAQVGGQHQLKPGGVARHAVAACQTNEPVLQWCSQRFQRADADLGAFVEEQHATVRPADGARAGHARAAADEGGHAGTVVWCHERRLGDQRRVRRQQAGHRVNRGDLQGLAVGQAGQQPRKPLRQHRFTHPRRPGQHQVMGPGRGHLDRETCLRLPHHVGQIPPACDRWAAR